MAVLILTPMAFGSENFATVRAEPNALQAEATPPAPSESQTVRPATDVLIDPKAVREATILDLGGRYGAVQLDDSFAAPGTRCNYDLRAGKNHVDVLPNPTLVWGFYSDAYQLVEGQVTVLEILADGSLRVVTRSVIHGDFVSDFSPTIMQFPRLRLPTGRALLVAYDFAWYFPGTTALDGYGTYGVDYYKTYYYRDSGTTGAGVSDRCVPPPAPTPTPTPVPLACTLSPRSGTYRTTVTEQCSGFRRGETVDIRWDSTSGTTLSSFVAGSGGVGNATFRVPSAKRGSHSVYAVGQSSGRSARSVFSVKPLVSLSPSSGLRGTKVTIRMYGFGSGEQITVRWFRSSSSSSVIAGSPVTASSTGSATLSFTIPSNATGGNHKIEAVGSAGNSASKSFAVTLPATATPTRTATGTPTRTPTRTATATPTAIATVTATPTFIPTETPTSLPTETPLPTETSVPLPTETPVSLPTQAPTETPTEIPPSMPTETETPVGL